MYFSGHKIVLVLLLFCFVCIEGLDHTPGLKKGCGMRLLFSTESADYSTQF